MTKKVGLVELTMMFVAVIAMASMVSSQREERILNRVSRQFTVYFQPAVGGPNANVIIVAGPNGGPGAFRRFGSLSVSDIPVTREISCNSPIIARAQGIAAESSLNGTERFMSFSLIFVDGEFKDSTIQLQGLTKVEGGNGELSVNSGSGYFRNAGGFAVVQTVGRNPVTNDSVLRYDITIKFKD